MSEIFDAKAFLKTVTSQPGVYRMYDAGGTVIYVGKAKDLKKRLSSYFRSNLASRKTEALVAQIQHIDVTVTHTETEALLLEHNYIKLYQPRYNVLLRDDKSYPFIFLSGDTHPRLAMHRGAKHAKGEYFGPFPNGYAVRETPALHVIQHIRDESHDHAIGGHRKKRAKVKNTSTLETIEGVGPKRRQMLLKYMGGLQGLRNASVEEIAKVPGISQGLAEKIFWSLKH